jgi:hypothetical protein
VKINEVIQEGIGNWAKGWGTALSNVAKSGMGMDRKDKWTGDNGILPGVGQRNAEKLKQRAAAAAANMPNTITPGSTGVPTPTNKLIQDFEIVNDDPLVIEYQNNHKKRYHLNSAGEWAWLGSDKAIPDQTTAALLDIVAGTKQKHSPASPAPTPATSAPTPATSAPTPATSAPDARQSAEEIRKAKQDAAATAARQQMGIK